jgi:hypothetical protein
MMRILLILKLVLLGKKVWNFYAIKLLVLFCVI